MEGKKIERILELGDGVVLIKMDDGTYVSAKIIDPEIPADDVNEFLGEPKPIKKEGKKEEKEEKETKKESKPEKKDDDEDDDTLTMSDLKGMKRKALIKLIEDRSLLVDPDDFEDDDDGLRGAIAEELEIEDEKKPSKKESNDDDDDDDDKGKDDDDYTWEDLVDMDFDELSDLCKENKLDTDPDDFEEGEEDKFRRAIAKECDIEAPIKKKK